MFRLGNEGEVCRKLDFRPNCQRLSFGNAPVPIRRTACEGRVKKWGFDRVVTSTLSEKHRHVPVECSDDSPFVIESLMSPNDRTLPLR